MLTGLITFHVIVCILLSITVLVQFGKGAEAGARMGGGSSQAIFTTASKGNFFTKMTTFLAIAFMVNSIALTTIKSKDAKTSIFDDEAPVAQPLNRDSLPKAEGVTEPQANAASSKKEDPVKSETKTQK